MASIARRSGEVLSIDAKIVHEKDEFRLVYGLESDIHHVPCIDGDPGMMVGAYCIVRFKDGSYQFEYMPKAKIDEHRKRSKGGNYGPWVTDYEEMAKKTVFRSIFKWLPVSIEAASVERADSNVINYQPPLKGEDNPEDMIEIDFVAAAPEEGAAE
jgi:recombination protein RecT